MTTLGTIQEPIINPWAFDSAEAGCFLIQDRYLAGFNRAVDGFYRSLSTESSYRRVSYSQLKFGSANDMALFLGSLREMRPAVPDQEKDDAGPLVYFDLHGNSAGIWDSRWPTNELEDALWEMRVRSAFKVFHRFTIKFASDQEERHFLCDCNAHGVKFGEGRYVPPKFQLQTLMALDPVTFKCITLNEASGDWTARRKYDGYEVELGPFGDQRSAITACSQFDFLVSLIPETLE